MIDSFGYNRGQFWFSRNEIPATASFWAKESDLRTSKGKSKNEIQGSFTSFRMTTSRGTVLDDDLEGAVQDDDLNVSSEKFLDRFLV